MAEIFRRRETKYQIDDANTRRLQDVVSSHLPLFQFRRNRPYTFITTVYFDTESLKFFNQARQFYDDSIKLRVKEYYYMLDGRQPDLYPHCFVEIKERAAGEVLKRRVRIPKTLLSSLFRREPDVWDRIVATDPGIEFTDSTYDVYCEIRDFLACYDVNPYSVMNYRRIVYQKNERELRVTFDDKLNVYLPPARLYENVPALTPQYLGEPKRKIATNIMEIKCDDEAYPGWLQGALESHHPLRISKFTTSIDFLNGSQERSDVPPRVAGGDNGVTPPTSSHGGRPSDASTEDARTRRTREAGGTEGARDQSLLRDKKLGRET